MENVKLYRLGILILVLSLGVVSADPVPGNAGISAVSPNMEWVADGVTEYRLDIYLDGSQISSDELVSAEWDVTLATHDLIPTRAELPDNVNNPSQNPVDFFYDFLMQDNPGGFSNKIDDDFSGGESTANWRLTANFGATGPADRYGLLGSYYFIVSEDAVPGTYTFNLNNVEIADSTLSNIYRSGDWGSGVTVEPFEFEIVAPNEDEPRVQPSGFIAEDIQTTSPTSICVLNLFGMSC